MAARRWSFHPPLFGLYFVLTLAASNTTDLKGWADLVWPIGISLAVCGVCWLAAYAWTRDAQKAALLCVIWFLAFSVFGYVAEALRVAWVLRLIGEEPGLGVLFVLALLGPSLAIRHSARRLESINQFVTVVGLCLVTYTTLQLYRGLQQGRDPRAALALPAVQGAGVPDARPDIYLIILDKYTGSAVLEQHFGFDNSAFEEFLRSRGFAVPRSSKANYPQTPLSLASMLNLDYLQNLPRDLSLYDLIEHNRLAAFLKGQGYRFAFFPTGFRITFQNRNADVQLPTPREVRGEFAAVWQNTTALPELLSGACALSGCEAGRFLLTAEAADAMDWKFERIKDLAGDGDTPTFVLAHLSLPHEPYLYHADCSHRDLYWPAGAGLPGDEKADRGYLDQIRCANRKLETLVDSILARSSRPPVILLQSDHGHGRIGHLPPFERLNAYQLRERMSVFAAYRLPGLPAGAIADSITPVNAVRLVLRHYFGAELPPLEDASYWGLEDRPFDLVRIRW